MALYQERLFSKGSDTLESFLSRVAFESDFRKKSCTHVMKTFAIFLLSKETFAIGTCSILASFFRKLLSKATFERKLASVSLALGAQVWHVLTRDHTAFFTCHPHVYPHSTSGMSHICLYFQPHPASPHFGWYSFPVPLRVGG